MPARAAAKSSAICIVNPNSKEEVKGDYKKPEVEEKPKPKENPSPRRPPVKPATAAPGATLPLAAAAAAAAAHREATPRPRRATPYGAPP